MKRLTFLIPLFLLAACGGDDEPNQNPTPSPTPSPTVSNANKNDATADPYLALPQMPRAKSGCKVVTHTTQAYGVNYSFEWDSSKRAQRWVCYELDRRNSQTNGNTRRGLWPDGDPWNYDPDIPQAEQQATYNELSKSYYPGTSNAYYEKGHICPSMDRLHSKDANEQTYYMTNIMPMVSNFNGKLWQKMETAVNSIGRSLPDGDTLYVCKGGTIDNANDILGKTINGHIVPRYYFMALMLKSGSQLAAWAFWAEHLNEDRSADELINYIISIDELEKRTGIDFFCNLADDVEEQAESQAYTALFVPLASNRLWQ